MDSITSIIPFFDQYQFKKIKRDVGDVRIADCLAKELVKMKEVSCAILGYPSSQGVKDNRGRTGAECAPDTIRKYLYAMTPDPRSFERDTLLLQKSIDLGNLKMSEDVAIDQERLGEVVAVLLQHNVIPIILGGGHDLAFGHFLGYRKNKKRVQIINIDAHADVRPFSGIRHSGNPFRLALDDTSKILDGYSVVGLCPESNSKEYIHWMKNDKRCTDIWSDEIDTDKIKNIYHIKGIDVMSTFDMDAVHNSEAPGVSAPAVTGISSHLFLELAYMAGYSQSVKSFDIAEVNPVVDVGDKTSRLGALAVWNFLKGLAARSDD